MVNPTTQPTSAAPARDGTSPRPLRGLTPSPARERSAAERSAEAAQGLSIVVPLHNEAASIARLHARLVEVARTLGANRALACEVVYVDDGSRDDTLAVARALPATALDVQVVSLSRNFGKEAALLAGLDHARLGAVLFIDGDGQHPTALIETLVGHWLDGGYDVVFTAKAHRANESLTRRLAVKMFYALINWGARTKIPEDASDFRLLSPRAADAVRNLPERNRFFKGLSSWIGFRQIRIDYQPEERADGRTTWNLRSLIGLSIDGLTAFSVAPLRDRHHARAAAGGDRVHLWRADRVSRPWSMANGSPAIRRCLSASWCSAACNSSCSAWSANISARSSTRSKDGRFISSPSMT